MIKVVAHRSLFASLTSCSSLDISWLSMLFTSSIFPRNFSASSSSLIRICGNVLEYLDTLLLSHLSLFLFPFFPFYRKLPTLTSFPLRVGCFHSASAQSGLGPCCSASGSFFSRHYSPLVVWSIPHTTVSSSFSSEDNSVSQPGKIPFWFHKFCRTRCVTW